jgi:hypothetical protein
MELDKPLARWKEDQIRQQDPALALRQKEAEYVTTYTPIADRTCRRSINELASSTEK